MSFDLELVVPAGSAAVAWSDVCDWATRAAPGAVSTGERQIAYEHPDTGVYFVLDRSDTHSVAAAFNLNVYRPGFFAREAMPLVVRLVADLGLRVIDPQGSGEPEQPDADALIERWTRGNRSAINVFTGMGQVKPTLDADRSLAWWQFTRVYREMVDEMDDFFVPRAILVADPGVAVEDREVLRLAVLTEPCMYVLPPVDYLIVGRGDQSGLLVRTERFVEAVGDYLCFDDDYPVQMITESAVFETDVIEVWQRFYDGVTPDRLIAGLKGIASDGFVDR